MGSSHEPPDDRRRARPRRGAGSPDVTYPYENPSKANFPEWLFEDPWALAHELGHLFGLGDDYRDGEVIPGREGTLMAGDVGADYVDRSILNDIAAIARRAGYELPECSTWVGTISGTSRGNHCEGSEEGKITPTVTGTSVTGGFEAFGSYTCDPGIRTPTSGSATLSGTFDPARFALSVGEVEGFLLASVGCLVGQQVAEIPIDGDAASAHVRLDASSGDVYECDVALERVAG